MCATLSSAFAGNGSDEPVEKKRTQQVQIVDYANLESLAGASLYIHELDKTIYADFDGFVRLDGVPMGKYHITVNLISYDPIDINDFQVSSKKGITKFRLKSVSF